MIERTALPDALFVDRALAAARKFNAVSGPFFRGEIRARQTFDAASHVNRKKQVRARS
jgi:hypothetical protein